MTIGEMIENLKRFQPELPIFLLDVKENIKKGVPSQKDGLIEIDEVTGFHNDEFGIAIVLRFKRPDDEINE